MHDFISKILKLSKKMTPNDMGQIKLIGIPTYQNQILLPILVPIFPDYLIS